MIKWIWSLLLFSTLVLADLNVCTKMPVATATANNWVSAITAAGATTLAQPAFSNLSGNISTSQMNSGTNASSSTFWRGDGTWVASGSGTVTSVTFTGDGTVLSSTPSAAVTTSGTLTAALANATARQFLTGPLSGSAAAPTYKALTAPTVTTFITTGTQTGWLFTISTSSTVAIGDTYTNNSNTYTVQGALSAQSGAVLWMSGTGATSGTTLTRSAGAGTSSITFSSKVASATFTPGTNPPPLYIEVIGAGGGGGGASGSNAGTQAVGNAGTATYVGPNLITLNGGSGGPVNTTVGAGGATTAFATGVSGDNVTGGAGTIGKTELLVDYCLGGNGGSNPIGSGAPGGMGNTAASTTGVGYGSGGGGGGAGSSGQAGSGGGAGTYCNAVMSGAALLTSYPYVIGTKGTGNTAGTYAGSDGHDGYLKFIERFQ